MTPRPPERYKPTPIRTNQKRRWTDIPIIEKIIDIFGTFYLVIRLIFSGLIEWSPKKISLVFLVLIPAFITLTYIFRNQIFSFFQTYLESGALAIMVIGIIQLILYFLMLAIYAPYRTTVPTDVRFSEKLGSDIEKNDNLKKAELSNSDKDNLPKIKIYQLVQSLVQSTLVNYGIDVSVFYKSQYYENVVIEYWLVRKILFIVIPLFIVLTTLSFLEPRIRLPFGLLIDIPIFLVGGPEPDLVYVLLSALWAGLFFTVSGGLLRMLFWLGRKDFRYNFAKGCAIISGARQESHVKLEYLMLSVNSYNKFLQRTLRIKMNELIQSRITRITIGDYEKIDEIDSYFQSADRLSPATKLSELSDLNLDNDEFFVKAKVERSSFCCCHSPNCYSGQRDTPPYQITSIVWTQSH